MPSTGAASKTHREETDTMFQFKNKNTQINPRKITSRCTSSGKGGTQGQGNGDFSDSLLTGRLKYLPPQSRYA